MNRTEVQRAAEVLQRGGIILYPTDTIWGIGCDATNRESVQKIYRIKQRDDRKSMLVLVNGTDMLKTYIRDFPRQAQNILKEAKKPTTIIYPDARNLADNLLAPDGSVGIRISSDPFCRSLMDETGVPLVSTSANFSGEQAPDIFGRISSGIREQVDYVVNWRQDDLTPSSPSAVIKLESDGSFLVLRP
jgi:L-threonylcarbamoyladenylate synthase